MYLRMSSCISGFNSLDATNPVRRNKSLQTLPNIPWVGGGRGGGVQNCHWLRTTRLDRQEGTESFRLLHGLMVGSFTEMEQNGRGAIFVCVCLIGIGGLLK